MRAPTICSNLLFTSVALLSMAAPANAFLLRFIYGHLCNIPLLGSLLPFCDFFVAGCGAFVPWFVAVERCNPDSEFCEIPDGSCETFDIGGSCVAIPDACTPADSPVCGCDAVTYDNDCERRRARVAKNNTGPCNLTCGGSPPVFCFFFQFCDREVDRCDDSSATGTCIEVGEACVAVFEPVCGCDGVTYNNDCERQKAAVSKASNGTCPEA